MSSAEAFHRRGGGSGAGLLGPVATALWLRLPRHIGVLSPSLSALLRDGDWTTSIPLLGAALPPAALLGGALVATSQSTPLWANDFWTAPVMLAIGVLGAGAGVWAALGYLIGLLLLWHDDHGQGIGQPYRDLREVGRGALEAFGHTTLPVIVAALVLLQLTVIVPAVAAGCRGLLTPMLRRRRKIRTFAEGLLSTVVVALMVVQWQLAAQYAVRPYWTFAGSSPDVAPFDVLRSLGWYLVAIAATVSVLRWVATLILARPASFELPLGGVRHIELPWPLTVTAQALLVTLLAAGVLATVGQGVIFFAVVAGGLILRGLLLPRIPGLARAVNVVPVLIRLVVLFVVAYLISRWRVGAAYNAQAHELTSFAETAALAILASAVLLIARQPRPWLPSWVQRRGATHTRPHPDRPARAGAT